MEDKYIVELYFKRDESAIEKTAKKYGAYCHSIAFNILGSNEDAQECVNDTYLGAWNSIPPHRPTVLSSFLGKITRRISIDRLRDRNAKKRGGGEIELIFDELEDCIADDHTPDRELQLRELERIINSFLEALSETERRVFLCRYWYADPIASISKQFGFSQSKVKSMLMRTREKLKKHLINEGWRERS